MPGNKILIDKYIDIIFTIVSYLIDRKEHIKFRVRFVNDYLVKTKRYDFVNFLPDPNGTVLQSGYL